MLSKKVVLKKLNNVKRVVLSRVRKDAVKKRYKKTTVFIQKKPFLSFFIALGILLIVIFLGSTVFKTKPPVENTQVLAKQVKVFTIGQSPRISVQGEVKKSGVIKIIAQTPGVVASINTAEGNEIQKGTVILGLSSNYQGGNAPSLQRQLAGLQYKNVKETYDTQKEIIKKQREIAEKQDSTSDEMRKIAQDSIGDTQELIRLNEEILASIDANPVQDIATKQMKSQYLSVLTQLKTGQRNAELQADNSRGPAQLSNIGKEIALAQLDLQEKALKLSLESSGVQLKLAQVQEALMFPAAPFKAVVQKIHVKIGEVVNPGTLLATISGLDGNVIVDAKVPQSTAEGISLTQKALIEVSGKTIEAIPSYISTEATVGQLYSVIFTIDESYRNLFTDSSFVTVSLAIGAAKSNNIIPFIPVDSVFQTQNEAFVFVVNGNKAESKKVTLGEVIGKYVNIEKGLNSNEQIILNRNIVAGDLIKVEN